MKRPVIKILILVSVFFLSLVCSIGQSKQITPILPILLFGEIDCNGVKKGAAVIDNCSTCVGGNTGLTACVQDCNNDWGGTAYMDNCSTCVDGNTGIVACASQSCKAILEAGMSTGDGIYTIDLDGHGEDLPLEVFCDMTTDGGGWTLIHHQGLLAYWCFDGSTPINSDIGGYSGNLVGATVTAETPSSNFGQSLSFDNNDSTRAELNDGVILPANVTISFWTKHTSCSNNQIPIMLEDGGYIADLYLESRLYTDQGETIFLGNSNCSTTVNTWSHHGYVINDGQVYVYRDGITLESTAGNTGNLLNGVIKYFGSKPGFGTNGMEGYLDDLVIYSRALSQQEIQDIYQKAINGYPIKWR